jgi:hypothetical protein
MRPCWGVHNASWPLPRRAPLHLQYAEHPGPMLCNLTQALEPIESLMSDSLGAGSVRVDGCDATASVAVLAKQYLGNVVVECQRAIVQAYNDMVLQARRN